MTPEDRAQLIAEHDQLVRLWNARKQKAAREILDRIGVIELALLENEPGKAA